MKKIVYISLTIAIIFGYQKLRVSAPDVITVFAGHDRTMCISQNLLLSDLQATISGDVNNGDWLTFGDGKFQPGNLTTVRYDVAQTNQITYVPGPNDKILGYYRLLLMSDAPTNNPQEKVPDEVRINFQSAPPLFCSNNINISLNESCSQKVDATMLQPNPVPPYSNYIITLIDPNGNIIPDNVLTKNHIDKEITYKLGHQCTSNICWGKFKVEDYYPPIFICKNDTIPCTKSYLPDSLGFPIPPDAYIDTIINGKYIVKNWDACSDVTLEYTDVVTKAECARDEDKTIARKWKASDAKGNTSYCTELVVVKRMTHAQVTFPPNYEGHEKPAFECGDDFPILANGHPSPDTTGSPIIGHCGNLQTNMTDVTFALCGNSYKIARSWFVIDWCTALSITKNQIIAVKDTKGPTISCQDTIYLSAGAYQCATDKILIPGPISITDCSEYNLSYELFLANGTNISQYLTTNTQGSFVEGLPVGQYFLKYIATDVCQNQSICETILKVEDTSPPYPACDGLTKISLDANGKARIFASTFDDGSTDNCGILSFKARKMTDQCSFGLEFNEYLDFCCAELGQTIMVAFEVTDIHGNKNTCMVEVIVEDKIKPTITCPPNITLACKDNYDFDYLDIFGTVTNDPTKIQNVIVNNFYHNGVVGQDGLAIDNCAVTITSNYRTDINCHTGFIYRTFTATDANGLKDSCTQKITILNPDPFKESDIEWPKNYTSDGCKTSQTLPETTGKPTFKNTQCGNIAATYEDTPFLASDSTCIKIFRVWTVIDWCQFDQSNTSGKWGPYTQIIKLHNTDKPIFTSSCIDTVFCSYDNLCQEGLVHLKASAEDPCSAPEELEWNYTIDYDQDGITDKSGQSPTVVEDIPIGQHSITWTVADPCGNTAKCTRKFIVTDCKKPTPNCISYLTLSLDQISGFREIWAKDFDNGSFDNCTSPNELYFTFDGYTPVDTLIDQEHYFIGDGELSNRQAYEDGNAQKWLPATNSSGIFIDCKNIQNGISDTLALKMTVSDQNRNQDFCQINLIIQDQYNHCVDNIPFAKITGQTKTEYNEIPQHVKINISAVEINDSTYSDNNNGLFTTNNLPVGKNYKLQPYLNSDVMQGITTSDLVIIQRHILGIKPLDSPYKMIAADVNGSKSISAADLVDIRKLILGIAAKLPKNTPSWVFVAKQNGIINPAYPFNYRSYIETGILDHDLNNQDFIAVKMGDVNQSAFNFDENNLENRNATHQTFKIMASMEKVADQHYLTFRSCEDVDVDGLQIFLHKNNEIELNHHLPLLTIDGMEYGTHITTNEINFLLYGEVSKKLNKGDLICKFALNNSIDLNNILLNNRKQSEIYTPSSVRKIELLKGLYSEQFKISIATNPVVNDLTININGGKVDTKVQYQIMDVSGKLLRSSSINLIAEESEYSIKLQDDIPTGIYFIHFMTGDYKQTLKFIRVN